MIYENLAYAEPVSYCSDNYLIHETNMDNPVVEDKNNENYNTTLNQIFDVFWRHLII